MSRHDAPPSPAASPPAEVAQDGWSQILAGMAQRQDRQAFVRLFGFFAPRIKAYMLRGGMAAAVAEEITQEALLSVWRKAHLFDPARASAATWVFTIARNLRIDAQRREARRREAGGGPQATTAVQPDFAPNTASTPAPDLTPDPAPLPDEIALVAEREALVRAALANLPADQAHIIRLSFFEGKPHTAIADELAIPLGTVKSRVRLAVVRLRKLLEARV